MAFPAISAGAYGWPIDDAARIAVVTVRSVWTSDVAEVRFVLFDAKAHAAFDAVDGPTDAEITARLAACPDEAWQALFAAADALTPADREVVWGGGQTTPSGAIQMPYPIYPQAVSLLTRRLASVGAVVVYDWMNRPTIDHTNLDSPATAARLATKVLRGERFCDGTIDQALKDGSLLAVVDRLRRWYEQERQSPIISSG